MLFFNWNICEKTKYVIYTILSLNFRELKILKVFVFEKNRLFIELFFRFRIIKMFALFVAVFALVAPFTLGYDEIYDKLDVDKIIGDDALFTAYINCLLDKGECSVEHSADFRSKFLRPFTYVRIIKELCQNILPFNAWWRSVWWRIKNNCRCSKNSLTELTLQDIRAAKRRITSKPPFLRRGLMTSSVYSRSLLVMIYLVFKI